MRRCGWIVAGAAVLLAAAWFGRAWLLPPLASWLDVGQEPRPVSAVLPLPGDANTRPFVAAAWVRVGLAETLLINNNEASPDVLDGVMPPTHEIIRRVAEVRGVDRNRIAMLRGASTNTADDLDQLARYMDARPDATVALVTSSFHTRRTRWTIRRRFPHLAERTIVISAPNPGFETRRWWWNDAGRRLIVSEYLKLAYYQLRYGYSGFVVGGVVLAVIVAWAVRRRQRGEKLVAGG